MDKANFDTEFLADMCGNIGDLNRKFTSRDYDQRLWSTDGKRLGRRTWLKVELLLKDLVNNRQEVGECLAGGW